MMVAVPASPRLGRFERYRTGKGGGLAKIAILNDEPEVVTLLSRFLTTRAGAFMKRVGDASRVIAQVVAFQPDLILIPLYRSPERIGLPLSDPLHDVRGATLLDRLSRTPELQDVPLVIFSFSVRPDELPPAFLDRVRPQAFLCFPEGLQELNPVISGFVGPAEGSTGDLERLRASLMPPNPADPEP
ncbi:hypothetical protein D3C72_179310 [compost metagenome]